MKLPFKTIASSSPIRCERAWVTVEARDHQRPSELAPAFGVRRIPALSARRGGPASVRHLAAFTLIEIAISLAIIGFALVAIIGILPSGMNVQKDNRQETIINQDETVFLNAIRNGERGLDDLTNYVMAITNYMTFYNFRGLRGASTTLGYTYLSSSTTPQFRLTNGARIIGLLSTPKMVPTYQGQPPVYQGFFSNHVVAFVRSISGPASEKYPQTNPQVQELALNYRLIFDISNYGTNYYDPGWIDRRGIATNDPEYGIRVTYSNLVRNLEANLHDVRLTFRWPLLPNGEAGPSRQTFRTMIGGGIYKTNEPWLPPDPTGHGAGCTLYYFEPRTYVKGT